LVRPEIGHILKYGFEFIDRNLRELTGRDNLVYEMHNYNSNFIWNIDIGLDNGKKR